MPEIEDEQTIRNRATLLGMIYIDWLGVFVRPEDWAKPITCDWYDPITIELIDESEKLDKLTSASSMGLKGMDMDLDADTPTHSIHVHADSSSGRSLPVVTPDEHEVRAILLGMEYHHGNGDPFYYNKERDEFFDPNTMEVMKAFNGGKMDWLMLDRLTKARKSWIE